ncbi:MAG: hypothetical protein U5N85_20390, partial [Arcicella sp.]|nr:hypothetical protein [Arcicella sp.]
DVLRSVTCSSVRATTIVAAESLLSLSRESDRSAGAVAFVALAPSSAASGSSTGLLSELSSWYFDTRWPNYWVRSTISFGSVGGRLSPMWFDVRCGGIFVALREHKRDHAARHCANLRVQAGDPDPWPAARWSSPPAWNYTTIGVTTGDPTPLSFALRSADRCAGNAPGTCLLSVAMDSWDAARATLQRRVDLVDVGGGASVDSVSQQWKPHLAVATGNGRASRRPWQGLLETCRSV